MRTFAAAEEAAAEEAAAEEAAGAVVSASAGAEAASAGAEAAAGVAAVPVSASAVAASAGAEAAASAGGEAQVPSAFSIPGGGGAPILVSSATRSGSGPAKPLLPRALVLRVVLRLAPEAGIAAQKRGGQTSCKTVLLRISRQKSRGTNPQTDKKPPSKQRNA